MFVVPDETRKKGNNFRCIVSVYSVTQLSEYNGPASAQQLPGHKGHVIGQMWPYIRRGGGAVPSNSAMANYVVSTAVVSRASRRNW
jgi:hypothetical protein